MDKLLDLYRNAPYDTFEAIMMCQECNSDETVIDLIMQAYAPNDLYVKCEDCMTVRQLNTIEAQIAEDFLGL